MDTTARGEPPPRTSCSHQTRVLSVRCRPTEIPDAPDPVSVTGSPAPAADPFIAIAVITLLAAMAADRICRIRVRWRGWSIASVGRGRTKIVVLS